MGYSKQIRTLDTEDVQGSLRVLLRQLNLVQAETERSLEELQRAIRRIEARIHALEGKGQ